MHSSYKWIVLIGAFIIYLFDALEIAALAFALPTISQEFQLESLQAGLLATATLIGMGFSGPTMGYLADNRGRKFALIVCMMIYISLTAALYIVPNFAMFIILRFIAGIGLGGVWSIISAFVVETWPSHQRGKAVAFVMAAFPIGGVAAAQLASIVLPDWRLMFLIAGLSAILPLIIAVVAFKESRVWQEEAASRSQGDKATINELFKGGSARTTILASVVAAAAFVAYYGASTWLPSYLETERGLSPQGVGQYMTWLNLGMFVGYIAFGWLADRIGKKNALLLSFFGSGILMPIYGLVSDHTVLLWLGPLYAFFMTFAGLFGSYLGELFPTRIRTTGAGFTFNVGRGVSAFAPVILGGVAAAYSFSTGLVVAGVIFILGGVVLLFMPKVPSDLSVSTPSIRNEGEEVHA